MSNGPERHMRVSEFANRSGYAIMTVRKKMYTGKIAYRKIGRIVTIPESELSRMLGDLVESGHK